MVKWEFFIAVYGWLYWISSDIFWEYHGDMVVHPSLQHGFRIILEVKGAESHLGGIGPDLPKEATHLRML